MLYYAIDIINKKVNIYIYSLLIMAHQVRAISKRYQQWGGWGETSRAGDSHLD